MKINPYIGKYASEKFQTYVNNFDAVSAKFKFLGLIVVICSLKGKMMWPALHFISNNMSSFYHFKGLWGPIKDA